MKSLRIAGLASVSILLCVSAFVLARQVQAEAPNGAGEPPAPQVEENLDRIEVEIDLDQIHQIVRDALEQARVAVKQAHVGREVHQALRDVDIHGIVHDALDDADVDSILRESLETTRQALRAADVHGEVRRALRDADIDRTISQAMEEVRKALAGIRVRVD